MTVTLSKSQKEAPKVSAATHRVNLVLKEKNILLFKDSGGDTFAWIPIENHKEVWPIRSKQFKEYLRYIYREDTGTVPYSNAVKDAAENISAVATFDGPIYELHNRVAWVNDEIWIDMSNKDWQFIRVNPDGWKILPETPVPLFRRFDHQLPQVEPARNHYSERRRAQHMRARLLKIMRFHNLKDKFDRILDIAHLVFALIPDMPHPVSNVHGPAGSGKTKGFHKTVKMLVDPSNVPDGLSLPRKLIDMVLHLHRHYYLVYTNVSYLKRDHSDILCRATDSSGNETRRLYHDDEMMSYRYQRCIGINAIPVVTTQEDLMDRSLLFELAPLPREQRLDETELDEAFEEARPEIFGAMLDTLADAMRIRPSIKLGYIERMGEFTKWGCAIAEALDYEHNDFLEAYADNRSTANEEVISSNILARVTFDFMQSRAEWEGAPITLYTDLTEFAFVDKKPTKDWPKDHVRMSKQFSRVSEPLYRSGVRFERDRTNTERTIRLSWCEGYGPKAVQMRFDGSDSNDGSDGRSSLLTKDTSRSLVIHTANTVTAVTTVTDLSRFEQRLRALFLKQTGTLEVNKGLRIDELDDKEQELIHEAFDKELVTNRNPGNFVHLRPSTIKVLIKKEGAE